MAARKIPRMVWAAGLSTEILYYPKVAIAPAAGFPVQWHGELAAPYVRHRSELRCHRPPGCAVRACAGRDAPAVSRRLPPDHADHRHRHPVLRQRDLPAAAAPDHGGLDRRLVAAASDRKSV